MHLDISMIWIYTMDKYKWNSELQCWDCFETKLFIVYNFVFHISPVLLLTCLLCPLETPFGSYPLWWVDSNLTSSYPECTINMYMDSGHARRSLYPYSYAHVYRVFMFVTLSSLSLNISWMSISSERFICIVWWYAICTHWIYSLELHIKWNLFWAVNTIIQICT